MKICSEIIPPLSIFVEKTRQSSVDYLCKIYRFEMSNVAERRDTVVSPPEHFFCVRNLNPGVAMKINYLLLVDIIVLDCEKILS